MMQILQKLAIAIGALLLAFLIVMSYPEKQKR